MVVSQAVGVEAACCDRETDALQLAGWWRRWVAGWRAKGGRQIKQDASLRFRDPWVT
jgi:hypothetical protein